MLELFAVRHICCQQIQLGSVLYISPVLPHSTEDQLRHELGKTEPSSGKEGSMTVAKHKEHNITLTEPSNGRGGSLTESNKENTSGISEPSNGRGGSLTESNKEITSGLSEPSNGRGGSLTESNKENTSGLSEPSNGRGGSKTAAKCEKHIIISDLFRNGSHGYFSCMCKQITNLLGTVF